MGSQTLAFFAPVHANQPGTDRTKTIMAAVIAANVQTNTSTSAGLFEGSKVALLADSASFDPTRFE